MAYIFDHYKTTSVRDWLYCLVEEYFEDRDLVLDYMKCYDDVVDELVGDGRLCLYDYWIERARPENAKSVEAFQIYIDDLQKRLEDCLRLWVEKHKRVIDFTEGAFVTGRLGWDDQDGVYSEVLFDDRIVADKSNLVRVIEEYIERIRKDDFSKKLIDAKSSCSICGNKFRYRNRCMGKYIGFDMIVDDDLIEYLKKYDFGSSEYIGNLSIHKFPC